MGGDGKRTKFPWLGVARYAVAMLLAVAVVATIVMAITVVLRPAKLELSVVNGAVSMDPQQQSTTTPQLVNYKVILRAFNPSGRAVIHFGRDNVVKLYFTAPYLEFLSFSIPTFALPQKMTHLVIKAGSFEANKLPGELADRLYNGESEQVLVKATVSLSFTVGRAGKRSSKTSPLAAGQFPSPAYPMRCPPAPTHPAAKEPTMGQSPRRIKPA
ncbi:hypothetical protein GUJ93_ZPchr0001g30006 [Zizania palustris]|uniref:Late embryogenesis abundant protein LEA-2 subgroup domain-containing protein n=1 Tax=Zizania palustris TaxID=103762 RepID=A0A8J5V7A8_ZIZPA|nr:hypothetical protein GUJ93_ZPchr0001g30006 [Zizania palustris]